MKITKRRKWWHKRLHPYMKNDKEDNRENGDEERNIFTQKN